MLNMCTWNMNGLARWNIHYIYFIRMPETNDLVCDSNMAKQAIQKAN